MPFRQRGADGLYRIHPAEIHAAERKTNRGKGSDIINRIINIDRECGGDGRVISLRLTAELEIVIALRKYATLTEASIHQERCAMHRLPNAENITISPLLLLCSGVQQKIAA